jgi:Phytanoyl-CoA dioxygenase (PhyH)
MPSEELPGISANTAAERLATDGFALLDRILSEDIVAKLKEEFDRRYLHLTLPGAEFENSLKTGDGRYMLTVELSGAFGDSRVYANPFLLEILNLVFGQEFVLENFGIVLSLPGAKAQHQHRDGTGLYGSALDALLPPYAVTVGIPLVDMNLRQGTTELFPGSHRWKEPSSTVIPEVPAGSAVMWDYRTLHGGTVNRSDRYRPLIYMTYGKPWWRDLDNFKPVWSGSGTPVSQRKVAFGKDFFKSVPRENRFLFTNAGVVAET